MAVSRSQQVKYVCGSCGFESLRWAGRCPSCGEWGTLEERMPETKRTRPGSRSAANPAVFKRIHELPSDPRTQRMSLGIGEVDRVLGNGVVPGEVVLLAGEPGIGKSTLLLQVALRVGEKLPVFYVSGEESLSQIASRVDRLRGETSGAERRPLTKEIASEVVPRSWKSGRRASAGKTRSKAGDACSVSVTDETDVDAITAAIRKERPAIVVVDSIQSMTTVDVASYAGSIAQVRECGARLTYSAKETGSAVIIVGQMTKEGMIAGPKVLEHVVDAVVYFEGDDIGVYRMLRCTKNRFGTTDEVGIFEMTAAGLIEVEDPAQIFRTVSKSVSGSAQSAIFKGSRTLFIEIQALTSPAVFGAPRRISTGVGKQRLEMLCAVLSKRAGIDLFGDDVFVSVIGGIKVDDPGVDLGICMAVASAKRDHAIDPNHVFVGEIGLSGEVRPVPHMSRIVSEAGRRKLSITSATASKPLSIGDVTSAVGVK